MKRRELFRIAGATAGVAFAAQGSVSAAAEAPAFVPPTKEKPILLCFNENPLGISKSAKEAIAASTNLANRYPFAQVAKMRQAVAEYMGGTADNILLTHGSAEAIRASVEAYRKPNSVLLVPELTYSDGADVAKRNNIPVETVKMGPNWSVDLDGMIKKAKALAQKHSVLVYFVNPNNPTSTIVDSQKLIKWISSKPKNTFFIVDEAYAEFVNDPTFVSLVSLVKQGETNVVVLRTFSKIFGMAGLRLGFAFGAKSVVDKIRDHVAYEVMMNQATLAAAAAELKDKEFLAYSKAQNDEAKDILLKALDELKIPYLPSQTNFVFIDLKAPLAPFVKRMREENIMVGRPFPPADTWCRISIGTPAEIRYFVEKLKEFRQKGWV
jgi:histidinol-phosphate aminotransferase